MACSRSRCFKNSNHFELVGDSDPQESWHAIYSNGGHAAGIVDAPPTRLWLAAVVLVQYRMVTRVSRSFSPTRMLLIKATTVVRTPWAQSTSTVALKVDDWHAAWWHGLLTTSTVRYAWHLTSRLLYVLYSMWMFWASWFVLFWNGGSSVQTKNFGKDVEKWRFWKKRLCEHRHQILEFATLRVLRRHWHLIFW